jgi:short-subunit dehydrogenase
MAWVSKLAFALSSIVIGFYASKIARFIHIYFIRSTSIGRYRHIDEGQPAWALVTGASDGIGLALVRELAQRGFDVVLHGRNQKKLEGRKEIIAKEFPGRSFRIVVADACAPGSELISQIDALVDDVKDLNLTILINNVGAGPPILDGEDLYTTVDKSTAANKDGWLSLNARFPMQLTSALLPTILKHQPGLIINIGSLADFGNPYLAVYSAAKAFMMTWSKALSRELKAETRDVEVIGVETANVTGVSWRLHEPATIFKPHTNTYAAAVLDRVGCGELVVNGYWSQGLMRAFMLRVPDPLAGVFLTTAMREVMAAEEVRNKEKGSKKD